MTFMNVFGEIRQVISKQDEVKIDVYDRKLNIKISESLQFHFLKYIYIFLLRTEKQNKYFQRLIFSKNNRKTR